MKIRGYIYYVFPVDYDTEIKEVTMTDCWFNKYFLWLFEFINTAVGLFCYLVGIKPWFMVSFRGKNKEKIKNLKKK